MSSVAWVADRGRRVVGRAPARADVVAAGHPARAVERRLHSRPKPAAPARRPHRRGRGRHRHTRRVERRGRWAPRSAPHPDVRRCGRLVVGLRGRDDRPQLERSRTHLRARPLPTARARPRCACAAGPLHSPCKRRTCASRSAPSRSARASNAASRATSSASASRSARNPLTTPPAATRRTTRRRAARTRGRYRRADRPAQRARRPPRARAASQQPHARSNAVAAGPRQPLVRTSSASDATGSARRQDRHRPHQTSDAV